MPLVFVYETLRNRDTLERVMGEPPHMSATRATNLSNEKYQIDGDDYWTVEPSRGDTVEGFSVAVSNIELRKLDKWEDKYHRIPVTLKGGDHSGEQAWAYALKGKAGNA